MGENVERKLGILDLPLDLMINVSMACDRGDSYDEMYENVWIPAEYADAVDLFWQERLEEREDNPGVVWEYPIDIDFPERANF